MTTHTKKYKANGSHLDIVGQHWEEIQQRDRTELMNMTLFEPLSADRFQFPFLNTLKGVDLKNRCLLDKIDHHWQLAEDSLLTLAAVIYLKNISGIYPMGQDIVGTKDLKEGHFFVGPHELRVQPILTRFGNDLKGFKRTAKELGGTPLEMADAAFRLLPFPRVPLYFLMWQGDDEFEPSIRVLFDRSIEKTFPADAIWGLVSRVSMAFEKND